MRKNTKKVDIIIIAVIILLIAGGILLTLLPQNEVQTENTVTADTNGDGSVTAEDYKSRKLGILAGTNLEAPTLEYFPDSEHLYFNSYSDIGAALTQNKIDGFLGEEPTLRIMNAEQPQIGYLSEMITHDNYAFGFPKDSVRADDIRDRFNEMLESLEADGTLEEMKSKWFGDDESKKTVDLTGFTGENGTLNVVTTFADVPFSYIKDNQKTGYSIELVEIFCRRYGYTPVIEDVDFSARIPGLVSGKYDMCASSLTVTEERRESIDFSEPVYNGGIVLAVRSSDIASQQGPVTADTDGDGRITYKDYAGKNIGVGTGSMFDVLVEKNIPAAKLMYFNTYQDMVTALGTGKVDAICIDEPVIKYIMTTESHAVDYIKEPIEEYNYGFSFPKTEAGKKLRDEFNEYLRKIKADGTMTETENKWFSGDAAAHTLPEIDNSAAGHGVLRLGVESLCMPFVYVEGNRIVGYEVDIAYSFCKEYDYGLEIRDMSFDAIIPSLVSGMVDFGCSSMNITEERAESVYFSEPDYVGGAVLAVRASELAGSQTSTVNEGTNFFESIAGSFEKNFIREDRWKLILEGIGTTCLITVLSAISGSFLAFLICMFRRAGSSLANGISNVYIKLLQGTPIVVLLMILYYVLLGKSGLEAVWVAVIGFTLNFGAYASEIMRSGIESIDGGQREAALALGYSENQAFFRFIFPQAAVRFIPVYKQEIVSLLKSTSIVGYIAIQDLTKMSDIIRSRTYEAFFPLIATAIIYFILAWVISLLLKIVLKAFDKRHRKNA